MIFIRTEPATNAIRLNFETLRPRRDILDDYCRVLSQIYDPVAYCVRVERLIGMLRVGVTNQVLPPDHFRRRHGVETVQRIVNRFPEYRDVLWRTFLRCYKSNPQAVRQTVILLSFFFSTSVRTRAGSSKRPGGRSWR